MPTMRIVKHVLGGKVEGLRNGSAKNRKYGRSPAPRAGKPRPAVVLQDDRFDATVYLDAKDMERVNQAILIFLGLGG
jgi:hypothetical protein